jgi:hypothetical protein
MKNSFGESTDLNLDSSPRNQDTYGRRAEIWPSGLRRRFAKPL